MLVFTPDTTALRIDRRGVRYVLDGEPVPAFFARPTSCYSCGRTWDDDHVTSVTPAPSGRCPFEYEHVEYSCANCGQPMEEPHTRVEDGEDVCARCCEECNLGGRWPGPCRVRGPG